MFSKLESFLKRFEELNKLLSDPNVVKDQNKFKEISKEHSDLSPVVEAYLEYKKVEKNIKDNSEILESSDSELRDLAREEITEFKKEREKIEKNLKLLLIPKDPNDDKNVILEIRAGTGGDEAAIFAADLFRMYSRFAERNNWKIEIISSSQIGVGGYKEIISLIKGKGVYSKLKYESGTHRVQRVPQTESGGRIHTSAATVAILPEATEVEIDINPSDLRVDTFRASGSGGQHVNTTDSAIRITHVPTGVVVSCQDEKSQHKNKAKAMTILRARIYEKKEREETEKRASERKGMVGTGDRSERIRTYNYPQGRISDHRINLTIYKLEQFMDGELDEMISSLITDFQAKSLKHEA
jgi:peptide chain release factor 1